MAFIDLIPVAIYFIASILMMKVFYLRMNAGQYAMFSAGTIMLSFAGIMKVIWKFLYALNIGDFVLLSQSFFPLQSMAFLLMFLGTAGMLIGKNGQRKFYSVAPVPVVTSALPFYITTFFTTTGLYFCLVRFNWKIGAKATGRFFMVAYMINMLQVYLGIKFDNSSGMHWTAQICNIISQTCFLVGAVRMKNASNKTAPKED